MNTTRMFKILWALSPAKFFFTLSVITLFTFSSCNKSSILGLEVQPPNDMINGEYQDTLTLLTQTIKSDTLKTSGFNLGILGKLYDPVFGETQSSIYTQMRMIANAPTFGKNPKCDSVMLSLIYYSNYYGKRVRKQQMVSVYELTSALDINTDYYSDNTTINYNKTELASYLFIPRPTDSIYTDTTKVKRAPQLRIPLPSSFGQNILIKQNTPDLSTNDKFFQFIKGLRISAENTTGLAPEEGNLLNFDMGRSTLDIYYKYEKDTIKHIDTTAVYRLSLSNVAHFMKYTHDFTKGSPDFQKQVVQTPAPVTNDVCYVQGLAGVKTRIKIPNLNTWGKKELIAINRAELVITAVNSVKDTFALPPILDLYGIANDGKGSYYLPDQFDGSDYFGGTIDTTTKNVTVYRFAITRYVQQVISGRLQNNGLHLTVKAANSVPYRFLLGGGTPTLIGGGENKYKMKLNITYTKLK